MTSAFTDAGIMVHAYLMYGFSTKLETTGHHRCARAGAPVVLRRLHSNRPTGIASRPRHIPPSALNPDAYGHHPAAAVNHVAHNDVESLIPRGLTNDSLGSGLRKACITTFTASASRRRARMVRAAPGPSGKGGRDKHGRRGAAAGVPRTQSAVEPD